MSESIPKPFQGWASSRSLMERIDSGEIMIDNLARIFVGFDSKEVVAYHVLSQSIMEYSSIPVAFSPIVLNHLDGLFTRERNPLQSTEFSFSRFMVPYLCNYEGWSLFMDCDMLARTDIAELWNLRDDRYAAMCVKHDYQPKVETKFLGQTQTKYQKKNWSSLILFNNAKCRALTKDFVNTATVEIYGEAAIPAHAVTYFSGVDPVVGSMTKYAMRLM